MFIATTGLGLAALAGFLIHEPEAKSPEMKSAAVSSQRAS
jgi:hypothetical protein